MDTNAVKQEIRNRISCKDYLQKSKSGLYNCPFCGSGNGIHHTGALKLYDTNTWTCHSCKRSGDVLDLIGRTYNVDYLSAVKIAKGRLNLADSYEGVNAPQRGVKPQSGKIPLHTQKTQTSANIPPLTANSDDNGVNLPQYSEYYKKCVQMLQDSPEAISYLTSRGIDLNVAIKYGIGFDPLADPARCGYKSPRIIIPTTSAHYIGRSIEPNMQKGFQKINVKGSSPGIFNVSAIYDDKNTAVFICEGVFDALSIIQAGKVAISLNSTSNTGILLQILKEKPSNARFIICFDNDSNPNTALKTKSAADELKLNLAKLNIKSRIYNVAGKYKDANEALVLDKEGFLKRVDSALGDLNRDDVTSFLEKIRTQAYKPYTTGISFFDDLLGGGVIRQSLLLLLAPPGTGKTTLAQQIAEAIALQKQSVIYLNLEMSREQMLAKAISSRLYRSGSNRCRTALDILQGYRWSVQDKEIILKAIDDYHKESYPYIRYNPDGVGSDLQSILAYLDSIGQKSRAQGRQAPVIMVDYLHLIGSREGLDAQELIKRAVTGLKEYAKTYDTFVMCIVATNRLSNTSGKITMESGRDSSNLEYTGDYQLSLNYMEIDSGKVKANEVDKIALLQQRPWRRMIIRVLKGRLCAPGKSAKVYFNAANNIFYGENDFIPLDNVSLPFDNIVDISDSIKNAGRR